MALYNTSTKEEFESKVINSNKLVLVDFWAAWCPPCRAMAPTLEQLGEENDDLLDIVKVDIESTADNQYLASEYGVRSIPNMPLFYQGKEVHRIVGLVSKGEVIGLANQAIAANK